MANNSYIGNYEYESILGTILVKSRVYKNVNKQKQIVSYEIFQSTFIDGKLAVETGLIGDPDWLGLTENDIEYALPRKASKKVELA